MNALQSNWKLLVACLLVGIFVAFGIRAATSHPEKPKKQTMSMKSDATKPVAKPKPTALLLDLGNTDCPVMNNAVDGKTYEEWNSLRVGFCCPGCDGPFGKDPAGVLDASGVKWREAVKAVEEYKAASGGHKQHLLAQIRKQWKVVREPAGDN